MINTAGWADLLSTHRSELVRVAGAQLPGKADAEDVVHEVALRVLRNGRPAAEVAAPLAYLRRAVRNECVNRWRRTGREVLVGGVPDRPADGAIDDCLDRTMLAGALAGLTERQRRVLTLSVLDDRADADVAAVLGVADVTVRTTRRRALARLRLLLAEAAPSALPAAHRPGRARPAEPGRPGPRRRPAGRPASWPTAA
jgi:RNA polymerase sigma factor (sigma-70 family)